MCRALAEKVPLNTNEKNHRSILENIAYHAMLERGLLPDFSPEVLAELDRLQLVNPSKWKQITGSGTIQDMRNLLWASIDNDDSHDLDQLSAAEALPDGKVKILVAVADVDALVKDGSAIDDHARHNTTTVYTAARIFSMLPEKLSTDLTSLNCDEDRLSLVIEMVVGENGSLQSSEVFRAVVRNQAQLAYNSVTAWLEGKGEIPETIAAVSGLADNLRLQDKVAQEMKNFRHLHGALSLETIEAKPLFDGDQIRELAVEERNRAKEIIQDFMIAANGVVARYLEAKNYPSIRRVVRTPKRWERIVELADEHGFRLPNEPNPKELEKFLNKQKAADPLRFPDLSLSVIKLMGAGEYVADLPGDTPPGHFGLAVKDYTHSTAPNRRYTDLLTHRLLKAALENQPSPYSKDELDSLAKHCTEEENAANKVERQVGKSAAALLLESRIGERFDAIVTGASEKGTWVRLLNIPVEGKLVHGFEGMDVGHWLHVELEYVEVERGYIDFKKVG
jgi:VacB/RNase II family 3'-5' exoribonuclease